MQTNASINSNPALLQAWYNTNTNANPVKPSPFQTGPTNAALIGGLGTGGIWGNQNKPPDTGGLVFNLPKVFADTSSGSIEAANLRRQNGASYGTMGLNIVA